jgi:hypothetical protein
MSVTLSNDGRMIEFHFLIKRQTKQKNALEGIHPKDILTYLVISAAIPFGESGTTNL